MKGPAPALLLLAAAIALRSFNQAPFEILDTTVWRPLLPPFPQQFLLAYMLPQLVVILAAYCWEPGFSRILEKLLKVCEPLWTCPLLILLGSAVFRHFGLLDTLFVSDEFSFNFHAICLAGGHLGCPPPPFPDHFQYATLYIGPDIWTGISAPGWPLLLALGYAVDCPRLVSPMLGGLITLQLQTLARRWSGPRAGALTGLVLLGSPMFMLNACADFSHLATTFWSANVVLCLDKVKKPGTARCWSVLAGASLGMVISTRPLDGLLLVVALLGWRVLLPGPIGRPGFLHVLLVGLGMLPTALFNFLQNMAVSGKPLVTAYALLGEVAGQFDLSPIDRLALCGLIYGRAAVWMFPGFLESIPSLGQRKDQGLFGLILLGLYLVGYARPGFVEIGSRYVLNTCLLLLPILAGVVCESKRRQACIVPCLLFSLLGAYPGLASGLMQHYRYQWQFDQWLAQALPSRSIAFFRRLPPGVLGIARNYPDLPGQIRALALDPGDTLKLRSHFKEIPAFYLDWIPEKRQFVVTSFEEPHDTNMDRICAGMTYANLKFTQLKALEQWAQIPPDSPFYESARQNRIKLLLKLGRAEEARQL